MTLTPERLDEIEERLSANYMKRASSLTMEKLDVIALIAAARANAKLVEALMEARVWAEIGEAEGCNDITRDDAVATIKQIDAALEAAGVKP